VIERKELTVELFEQGKLLKAACFKYANIMMINHQNNKENQSVSIDIHAINQQ
jgi:hypothetical protein